MKHTKKNKIGKKEILLHYSSISIANIIQVFLLIESNSGLKIDNLPQNSGYEKVFQTSLIIILLKNLGTARHLGQLLPPVKTFFLNTLLRQRIGKYMGGHRLYCSTGPPWSTELERKVKFIQFGLV